MIVPQPRLLFWYAVTVLPLSVLGVVWTEAWLAAGVALLLLVGLTVVDLLLGQGRLAGLQVKLPAVARFSKDREGGFEVLVRNERQQAVHLRLGLGFPPEIRPMAEDQIIALPAQLMHFRKPRRLTPSRSRRSVSFSIFIFPTAGPTAGPVYRNDRGSGCSIPAVQKKF